MTIQDRWSGTALSPNLLIISLTLLVILMTAGWYVYHRSMDARVVPAAVVQQRSDLFQQMALKCHGNFSLLSPEDQAVVQKASNGNGAMVIQGTALHYGIH